MKVILFGDLKMKYCVWRPVYEIGGELGPLCDRPGDHRGGGGGKDELEA